MQTTKHLAEKQILQHMFTQNKKSAFFNLLSSLFMYVYFEITNAHFDFLPVWISIIAAVAGLRFIIAVKGQKLEKVRELHRMHRYLTLNIFINGLLWGGFYCSYYSSMTLTQSLFTTLGMIGGVTFAVVSFAASRSCYFSFLLPVIIPVIVMNVFSNQLELQMYGIAVGLYSAFNVLVFYTNRKMLWTNTILAITQNKLLARFRRLNGKLKEASSTDHLTTLANRRLFNEHLSAEWARAKRAQHPIAMVIIDIDYFKEYNDHYGHLQGDECLKNVALVLKKAILRDTDLVARFGGDEMVIVLYNTDAQGAKQVVINVINALKKMGISHEYSPYGQVTLSIGIAACVPMMHDSEERLLGFADQALYQVKEKGRNNVAIATYQTKEICTSLMANEYHYV